MTLLRCETRVKGFNELWTAHQLLTDTVSVIDVGIMGFTLARSGLGVGAGFTYDRVAGIGGDQDHVVLGTRLVGSVPGPIAGDPGAVGLSGFTLGGEGFAELVPEFGEVL